MSGPISISIGLWSGLLQPGGPVAPSISFTGLTNGYAKVGDDVDISVNGTASTPSAISVLLDDVEVATSLPYTVPDSTASTLKVVATIDGSPYETAEVEIGKAPTVTIAIDQSNANYGNILGDDLTAAPTISNAGYPALTLLDIDITWEVDSAPVTDGYEADFDDSIVAVAAWDHPLASGGSGTASSSAKVVPSAAAPSVSVAFNGTTYVDGQTITSADIDPSIDTTGYPALQGSDLTIVLLVDNVVTAFPHTASEGEVLKPRVTASHPTGAISVDGATKTVEAAPAVASITDFSISAQSGGDVVVNYVSDIDTDIDGVLFQSSDDLATIQAAITATQVRAGNDHTNTAAEDGFTASITAAGSAANILIPSALDAADFYMAIVADGATDVQVDGPFSLDTTAPSVETRLPADNATDVAVGSAFVIDMDEDMAAVGTFTLKVVGGATVETFDLSTGTGDDGGTIARGADEDTYDEITITPGNSLSAATEYCFRSANLTDLQGNPLPDVADDTTWSFTTTASSYSFLDDFNRANANLEADTDYTCRSFTGNLDIVSNKVTLDTDSGLAAAIHTGATPPANQKISATVQHNPAGTAGSVDRIRLIARSDAGFTEAYFFEVYGDGRCYLFRRTGDSSGSAIWSGPTQTVANDGSDTMDLKVTGTGGTVSLTPYWNGVALTTFNDTNAARKLSGYGGFLITSTGVRRPTVDNLSIEEV